jgi:hypothetical protein
MLRRVPLRATSLGGAAHSVAPFMMASARLASPVTDAAAASGGGGGGGAPGAGGLDLERMAFLFGALPKRFVSWADFGALCARHGIADADAAAAAFARCGAVVTAPDGVHCHAPQAVRDACTAMGSPWNACADLEHAASRMRAEVARLRPAYEVQLARCVSARRATWSGMFAFTGVQLAVISRLTYFDLNWDTMEPVSYFLGSGISVLAFAFTMVRGFDFSSHGVDAAVVRAGYVSHPDVVAYFTALEEAERIEAAIADKSSWVRTGRLAVGKDPEQK